MLHKKHSSTHRKRNLNFVFLFFVVVVLLSQIELILRFIWFLPCILRFWFNQRWQQIFAFLHFVFYHFCLFAIVFELHIDISIHCRWTFVVANKFSYLIQPVVIWFPCFFLKMVRHSNNIDFILKFASFIWLFVKCTAKKKRFVENLFIVDHQSIFY